MSLVAGVDLSTKRIDLAAVTYDEPLRLWLAHRDVEQHGSAKDAKANGAALRTRAAADALHDCIVEINRTSGVYEITNVAIELPFGQYARPLLPTYGALCGAVPRRMIVTGMTATEWRYELGAGPSKAAGHAAVWGSLLNADRSNVSEVVATYDEHELDAIGIALAYRQMLHSAVAA